MTTKAKVAAFAATLVVGILLGNGMSEPETHYKVLHDTETKTITETVEVPAPVPTSCASMAVTAKSSERAAERLDVIQNELLDIMSNLRIAVAEGNSNAANTLETQLRKVQSRTISSYETLAENQTTFKQQYRDCQNGVDQ